MVEGARLEIVCALIAYREFESLTLRHFLLEVGKKQAMHSEQFFRMEEQTDRDPAFVETGIEPRPYGVVAFLLLREI